MCQRLEEVTAAMRMYATRFDASRLSCADAATAVREAAAIEHMAATVKALAAARAAQGQTWKTGGHRSAEEQLAQTTGTSVSGAREALALGRRLAEQPEVADAARRGDLSPTQASAISDAVAADPEAARRLVDSATAGGSLAELKDQCAAVKAAAVDLEARRAAIHKRRHLRWWTDAAGMWHLVAGGNPEHGAQVIAALAPLTDQAFQDARQDGRREHPDAYRFDALVRLAVNSTSSPTGDATPYDGAFVPVTPEGADVVAPATSREGGRYGAEPGLPGTSSRVDTDPMGGNTATARPACGAPTGETTTSKRSGSPSGQRRGARGTPRSRRGAPAKLLLRVDLDAFLRGFPTSGETCDLVGCGPISMSAVHDILKDSDPFIAAVLTKSQRVVGVAHLGRKPTAYQRSCLEWVHPTCAAQGCPCSARLEIDHRVDWIKTRITLLDWLDALCHHHHQLKTRDGWSLADGIGKRPFVPPTDPRHPKHRHLES